MIKYNQYRFIYPPRAEAKIQFSDLPKYDTSEYLAQPKYNGSCCCVFTNGDQVVVMNRHNEPKSKIADIDFRSMYTGPGWMVVAGELMDKSKKGEHGETLSGFIAWDLLVFKGEYLVEKRLSERLELMESLWPCNRMLVSGGKLMEYQHLCLTPNGGIFKSPTYIGGNDYFTALYNELIKVDAYEGLVLKKADSKLELGFGESNNSGWQLKVRKGTKNYKF